MGLFGTLTGQLHLDNLAGRTDDIGMSEPTEHTTQNEKDARLERQAIRQRWNIPAEFKDAIVKTQVKIAVDPNSGASHRERTAAARALIQMEQQNQADTHKEMPDLHEISLVADKDLNEYTERLGLHRGGIMARRAERTAEELRLNGNGNGTNGNGNGQH